MLHSGMSAAQVHKTKTITNPTSFYGWWSEKDPFKDVWCADKCSSWSDSEMSFQVTWITTCQTSINCGFNKWVSTTPLQTCPSLKPTLTLSIHCLSNLKTPLLCWLEAINMTESWLIQPTDFKDKLKVRWRPRFTPLPLKILRRSNSLTQKPECQSPRLTMRTWSRPKPLSRNSTETSEKSLNSNQENTLTQSTTREDKREWESDFQRDGTHLTPSSQVSLPKSNNVTETISRLILTTTEKTKESNNS